MGLFSSNKGKDSLRPLSEEDIQRKLYGNIKSVEPAAIKKTEKKRAPKPAQVAAPVPVYEHSSAQKEIYHTEEIETPQEKSNAPTDDDLFSRSYDDVDIEEAPTLDEIEVEEEASIEEVPVESKEQVREQNIMARLAEIAEQEKRKEDELKAASSPRPSAIRNQNVESIEVKKSEPTTGSVKSEKTAWFTQVVALVSVAGKALLGFLSAVIIAVVNGCLKLLSIVDFRKSKVRRILYWVAGIVCLVLLFGAIHLLNVKREAAMKTPGSGRSNVATKQVQSTASNKPVVKKVPVDRNVISTGQTEVAKKVDSVETKEAETVEKSRDEAAVTSSPSESDQSPAVGTGRYVIQVATYAGPKDAEKVVNSLREANLKGFMKSLSRSSGKVYYSVFLGRYDDFQEAQEAFAIFKKNDASSPFSDAFIRTLNQ